MELEIKRLQQNGEDFVPQTVAEAVLVNDTSQVITLDKVLDKKIENISTPTGSGLQSYRQGKSVILTHSNIIEANSEPSPVNIQYDSHGHIINTSPTKSFIITIDSSGQLDYNGKSEQRLDLGDDFKLDEQNKVALKWKEL